MRPNRVNTLTNAPTDELLTILLRQYKRLLAERGVTLTETDIHRIAQQEHLDEQAQAVRKILIDLIEESKGVLMRWNLTFEQSINTEMADIPGWESTSDFLEIANEKSNAELRIASGAALVAALGDLRYADVLRAAINHDPNEIETVIAQRILNR